MAGADKVAAPETVVLRQIMDSLDVAIAFFDADDRLVFWNDAYVDLNRTIAPMIRKGVSFQDLLAELVIRGQIANVGDDVSKWVAERMDARNSGKGVERHLSDGRWFHVRELRVPEGGTLGFWTDITEQKKASTTDYDSSMGDLLNEMNNNLQAISGNIELALESTYDPPAVDFLHQALKACMALGARSQQLGNEMAR